MYPNPDIEIVIASETKQSRPFAMRLPRTFQVLAMTGWENGFFFYIGIWALLFSVRNFLKVHCLQIKSARLRDLSF
jgi:hypothetical protein